MLIPAYCSDQPAAVACEQIFTVTQQAAIIAGEAVRNCFGERCADIPIGVSHGDPVGGGDYVVAWLASITPPNVTSGKTFFAVARLSINVVICLSGFPRIETTGGDITPVASIDEYTHAAYFSYGAMESAYRAIVTQLAPGTSLGGCTVAGLSSLTPQQPAVGHVRWSLSIYVDWHA